MVFGIYRLLRAELQIRNFPWGRPLFLVVWISYWLGFVSITPGTGISVDGVKGIYSTIEVSADGIRAIYFAIAYLVVLNSTFLAVFFTPKNIVHYFRWWRYLNEAHFKRSLTLMPAWIITMVFALLLLFPLIFFLYSLQVSEFRVGLAMIGLSITLFFFLIRDLELLYYLAFDFKAKRAHLATVVYLIVLYTLLPILLSFTNLHSYWFPAFAPWSWVTQTESVTWAQIAAVVFLVILQAGISWSLVVGRWREAARQLSF